MTVRSRPQTPIIRSFQLDRCRPAVTFDVFAIMLEIDLRCGHRREFRRRLRQGLKDAARQAIELIKYQRCN